MISFVVVCAFMRCGVGLHIDLPPSDESRYEHGKAKLVELRRYTGTRYGPCWTAALQSLEDGCRQLTEDVQHDLALKFVECFLLKTGREIEPCEYADKADCTRRMSSEIFSAYTEFFTHTQSICFYLQASEWQISTGETIDRLTDSSASVVEKLESADGLQHELLRKQNDSLHIQQNLLEGSVDLRQSLESSKDDVKAMMQEFQTAVSEQKKLKGLVFEVFSRVQSLQSLVLGEFAGFYSLIFYALAIVIVYVLTSTPRTSGARFWLFLVLTMNFAIELILAKYYDVAGELDPVTGNPVDENVIFFMLTTSCAAYKLTHEVTVL